MNKMLKEVENKISDRKIEELMNRNSCSQYRIMHIDEMYTSEYVENRLNVEIDKNNNISRVWIG